MRVAISLFSSSWGSQPVTLPARIGKGTARIRLKRFAEELPTRRPLQQSTRARPATAPVGVVRCREEMPIPEPIRTAAIATVRNFCDNRVPAEYLDQIRVDHVVRGNSV